jgi:outer membrane protein OmpA-like peptidoglycan-associated protein
MALERRRQLAIVLGAAGIVVLTIGQAVPNRHSIENDLTDRSTRALRAAGLSNVDVHFTGRDGTLRVASRSDVDKALAVVRAQEGVRVATAEVPPGTATQAALPAITVMVDGGRITLTGTVPSQVAHSTLLDAAVATAGSGSVDDRLSVVQSTAGDLAITGLAGVIRMLGKDGKGVVVELRDGTITLSGTVPTQATKDNAARAAVVAVGKPSAVVDRLQVAAAQPASPQEVQNQLAKLTQVSFDTGSATLTPDGRAVVVQVADVLKANPTVKIRIEGHTDSTGTAASNLALSQSRALAVQATLQSLGIASDRLTSIGYGATRPKVPDNTPANQAINRRVEFIVTGS